mgnify:CR=1 FL=1
MALDSSTSDVQFRVSQVVRLNSGGPAMTIGLLGKTDAGDEVAVCYWTDDVGQPASCAFPLVCLRPN